MHRTGTKHIVRHMQKSIVQWSVISKFTCTIIIITIIIILLLLSLVLLLSSVLLLLLLLLLLILLQTYLPRRLLLLCCWSSCACGGCSAGVGSAGRAGRPCPIPCGSDGMLSIGVRAGERENERSIITL